jgi:hypothetical protein
MSFSRWLHAILNRTPSSGIRVRPINCPVLEPLEQRLTPAGISTYTNASIALTPNFFAGSVTEKVTAIVSPVQHTFSPGQPYTVTALGGPTPDGGTVFFGLNNQQQKAQLNSQGQATATFTLPLFSMVGGQMLTLQYEGFYADSTSSNTFFGSNFNAPVYLSFYNLLLPSTITFNTFTPWGAPYSPDTGPLSLQQSNSSQGETNSFSFITLYYTDPGTVSSIQFGGFNLPGSLAAALGIYGTEFMSVSSYNPALVATAALSAEYQASAPASQPSQHLDGDLHGSYTIVPSIPDTPTRSDLSGSGSIQGLGQVTATGALVSPGFIANGYVGGTLTLQNANGTLTLQLVGPSQLGFAPLPNHFDYTIVSATGAYTGMHGSGTIDLQLQPNSSGPGGTFTMNLQGNVSQDAGGTPSPIDAFFKEFNSMLKTLEAVELNMAGNSAQIDAFFRMFDSTLGSLESEIAGHPISI